MRLFNSLFPGNLPCVRAKALSQGEVPSCLQVSDEKSFIKHKKCPMCEKLKTEMESFQAQAYKGGYDYIAWVVTDGPNCELVTFASEPSDQELHERFGKELVAVVPVYPDAG